MVIICVIKATVVHKIETTFFSRLYLYYLEVYKSTTRVNIIGSIQNWYPMKELSPNYRKKFVTINFQKFRKQLRPKKILFIFCFGPNLKILIFTTFCFHWVTCNFLRRLTCNMTLLRSSKYSKNDALCFPFKFAQNLFFL